jgi:hypothetical protein
VLVVLLLVGNQPTSKPQAPDLLTNSVVPGDGVGYTWVETKESELAYPIKNVDGFTVNQEAPGVVNYVPVIP